MFPASVRQSGSTRKPQRRRRCSTRGLYYVLRITCPRTCNHVRHIYMCISSYTLPHVVNSVRHDSPFASFFLFKTNRFSIIIIRFLDSFDITNDGNGLTRRDSSRTVATFIIFDTNETGASTTIVIRSLKKAKSPFFSSCWGCFHSRRLIKTHLKLRTTVTLKFKPLPVFRSTRKRT